MNSTTGCRRTCLAALTAVLAGGLAGCDSGPSLRMNDVNGSDGHGPVSATLLEPPPPSDFVDVIDNPWMPWRVGSRWVYEGDTEDGHERIVVTVTGDTRVVAGVTTTVVRDVVYLDGVRREDTDDWFAQDRAGNVWYFGEETREFDDGQVDTAGSWETGVDGARAGIAMLARPQVGDAYYQEYYPGEAEDEAVVVDRDGHDAVPYGSFDRLLHTRDSTALEPSATEHKYYARGVGVVLETSEDGGQRVELVSFRTAR